MGKAPGLHDILKVKAPMYPSILQSKYDSYVKTGKFRSLEEKQQEKGSVDATKSYTPLYHYTVRTLLRKAMSLASSLM